MPQVLRTKYRYFIMIPVGMVIAIILQSLVFSRLTQVAHHEHWYDHALCILCTIAIWEANIFFDTYLNKRLLWERNAAKRALLQFFPSMVVSTFCIYVVMKIYGSFFCVDSVEHDKLVRESLIITSMVVAIILIGEVSAQFFRNWKNSLIEIEQYKTATTQAQLQNLKNQVNPHFLFNNMSVLSGLIHQDQDKAVDFVHQLSKVYRYLLDNRNNELVSVESEIGFLDAYIYLMEKRFEKNISFSKAVDDSAMKKYIPPMCIQILVENAIKHNEISSEKPLHISIDCIGDNMVVKNKIQPRTRPEPSGKMGLQNIQERYAYLSSQPVIIDTSNNYFSVTLPLLQAQL